MSPDFWRFFFAVFTSKPMFTQHSSLLHTHSSVCQGVYISIWTPQLESHKVKRWEVGRWMNRARNEIPWERTLEHSWTQESAGTTNCLDLFWTCSFIHLYDGLNYLWVIAINYNYNKFIWFWFCDTRPDDVKIMCLRIVCMIHVCMCVSACS